MTTEIYRQGDVLIVSVKEFPANLDPVERENGRVVLAHGEVTGHAHAIEGEGAALFRAPKLMAVFITITGGPAALEHQEHDPMVIPPGVYRVIRQRKYAPEEIRNVAD
jgi:hypothetical protein